MTREICSIFFLLLGEFSFTSFPFLIFYLIGKKKEKARRRGEYDIHDLTLVYGVSKRVIPTHLEGKCFFSPFYFANCFVKVQLFTTAIDYLLRPFALSLRQEKTKATQTVLKTCLKNNLHLTLTEVLPSLR